MKNAKPWTIATARQQLAEVIGRAAHEPQYVYRRDKLVAAVVSPELAGEIQARLRPTLASRFAELQRLCAEENYELTIPPRRDRANPLAAPPATRAAPRSRSRARRGAKR